jgi:hypothetical protein
MHGLTFYDDELLDGVMEARVENTDVWNEATAGAVLFTGQGATTGRTRTVTSVADTVTVVPRDPNSTATDSAYDTLGTLDHKSIKVYSKSLVKLGRQELEEWGLTDPEGAFLVGQGYAARANLYYAEHAAAALIAGIGAVEAASAGSAVKNANTENLTQSNLYATKALLGDKSQTPVALWGHGKTVNDLVGESFSNSTLLAFQLGNTQIVQGSFNTANLTVVPSDLSQFIDTVPIVDEYSSLVLVPGAVEIMVGETRTWLVPISGDGTNASHNMLYEWRLESSAEIKLRGLSWTGSEAPLLADIATPGNWSVISSQTGIQKTGPGTLIINI